MIKKFRHLFYILLFIFKSIYLSNRFNRVLLLIGLAVLSLTTNLLLLTLNLSSAANISNVEQNSIRSDINSTLTHPNTLSTALERVEQGRTLYETGQFSEAAIIWQEADTIFAKQGDLLNQAMVLSNLSSAYQELGQWEEAKTAITNSLILLQNIGHSNERTKILAQALNTQGNLQLNLGQPEQALATWQEATATYTKAGDEIGVIRSQINQAQAMQALGLYRRALITLTQTNQQLEKQPDSLIKIAGFRTLGNTLRLVGNFKQSSQVLQQSLELARKLESHPDISATLFSLGNTAIAQQDNKAALNFYQQAELISIDLTLQIQSQINQLIILIETDELEKALKLIPIIQARIDQLPLNQTAIYAKIHLAQNQMKLQHEGALQDSAQLLTQAIQQAKSLNNQRALSYAIGNLAKLYEQTQQFSDAQKLTQEALIIAQSIEASDIAYEWQWQMGRILKAQGDRRRAIAFYTETVSTLKSLRRDLVVINQDIQFSFREEVEPVYRQLVELLLTSDGTTEPSQDNLKQARYTIDSLQLAELDNFFREACLEAKVEVDNVVDAADYTAAVIYPIILEQRLDIILKLPGQENLHHYATSIPQNQVESTIANLQNSLRDVVATFSVKQQSQQIYNWLIRPIETELVQRNIKTLVFVLDGSLRNIPMAVLFDNQQNNYLIEKYAIALTPGLQLIKPKPLQQVKLMALTAGVDQERNLEGRVFSSLPNVSQELTRIQSQIPNSQELFNQQFTLNNLKNKLQLAPFSVVHLATHGEFSSNPDETFILTWNQLLKVRDFDTLLKITDQNRQSAIELLVLSACQTAEGDKRAALGLAGIAVRAGARSTLATLWSVDDQSTSDLMNQFYHELNSGITKAEALQRAQMSIFYRDKRPFFWAPYVLVGNWL